MSSPPRAAPETSRIFFVHSQGNRMFREDGKVFTLFTFTISPAEDPTRLWRIERRYSDFQRLHSELRRFQSLPPLPPKKLFGSTSSEFVEKRHRDLVEYVAQLQLKPGIASSSEFQKFIEADHLERPILASEDSILTKVTESSAEPAGHRPERTDSCAICFDRFSMIRRSHVCAKCHRRMCSKCSTKLTSNESSLFSPQRVCSSCLTSGDSRAPPSEVARPIPSTASFPERIAGMQAEMDELRARVTAAEGSLQQWQLLIQAMLFQTVLNPSFSARYVSMLNSAFDSIQQDVDAISRLECTSLKLPLSPSECPLLSLTKFDSETRISTWRVEVKAHAVDVDIVAEGKKMFKFVCSMQLSIALLGNLEVHVDASSGVVLLLAFSDRPTIRIPSQSKVKVGSLPLPIQDKIKHALEKRINSIVFDRLVKPSKYSVVLMKPDQPAIESVDEKLNAMRRMLSQKKNPCWEPSASLLRLLGVTMEDFEAFSSTVPALQSMAAGSAASTACVLAYQQLTMPQQQADFSSMAEVALKALDAHGVEQRQALIARAKSLLIATNAVKL